MYQFKHGHPYTMPTASWFRQPRPWEQGGMLYGRCTALSIAFVTDGELADQLLPVPFRLDDEPLISVHYVMCEDVEWLAGRAYNLVAVDVAAVFDGEVDRDVHGGFCVIMWENLTEPILGGRDHSGVPKVFADITNMTRLNQTCTGQVSHFDHPILNLAATQLQQLGPNDCRQLERARREGNAMNLKHYPTLENDGADLSYACTYPSSGTCTAAWRGSGELRFHTSSFEKNPTQYVLINKLAELPIHKVNLAQLAVWEPLMALDRLPRRLQ